MLLRRPSRASAFCQTPSPLVSPLIVYAVVDDAPSPELPLGVGLEVFIRREDAERFVEEVRGDDPARPLGRKARHRQGTVRVIRYSWQLSQWLQWL